MMTRPYLLFVLLLVVLTCSLKADEFERSARQTTNTCASVQLTSCSSDQECTCSTGKLICNSKYVCNKMTLQEFLRRLQKKIPCPSIFKKRCASNVDCAGCKTHVLRCEDNECVKARKGK